MEKKPWKVQRMDTMKEHGFNTRDEAINCFQDLEAKNIPTNVYKWNELSGTYVQQEVCI